jgi:hypothetical protein
MMINVLIDNVVQGFSVKEVISDLISESHVIPIDKSYVRQLSEKLYQELLSRLSKNLDRSIATYIGEHGYYSQYKIEYKEVYGLKVQSEVPIYVTYGSDSADIRSYVKAAGVTRIGSVGSIGKKLKLELQFKEITVGEFKDEKNKHTIIDEIYNILIHEITHLSDLLEPLGKDKESIFKSGQVYYNKPSEVRAFTQQIVDEVEKYMSTHPNAHIDDALKFSVTWNRISKDLTNDNKKLISKAVYSVMNKE